ncbi:LPS export ABC transporter permease LptG [Paracoccus sp. 1_MG-2023]|uniref:LPS export ABC transporter permease LptG n=1 Tax=Paracoccus sp. 1_MG-2023 TaxID=3062651 RepID=UPI001C0A20A5|nr:LPS export ABC transporter permease LptG [Paracoccus sp. 1_MG-2023]MBU2956400.1 LPS export ABC transporter permease LptG [Paracoccus sp. C2R09]MDO6669866.1 LPS export ABC transporter permease LptG [Paracoccus sp. 1_MG-2023]
MILARYVARRFLRSFLMIAGIFLLILFLIDMIEIIRRFSGDDIGLAGAARLAALNIADSFYSILPLMTVLAGIALFLGLARSSEMVAIRASGRSGMRVIAAPALTAVAVGALTVGLLNPLVAATGQLYDDAVDQIDRGDSQTVSLGDSAVWLRQAVLENGEESGQIVIRARRASADALTLHDATFLVFDAESGPVRRIEAQTARLTPGAWGLAEVRDYPLDAQNPQAEVTRTPYMLLPSDLTAQRIREGFGRPESVPVWQLPGFIAGLERAGFSAARHKVWFQMELARPFLMGAMVLIAAAFTMQHVRGRNTGVAVLLAFAAGIALFFLRNMAQVLGDNGQVGAVMAAWTPPLVGALLALGLILKREDG